MRNATVTLTPGQVATSNHFRPMLRNTAVTTGPVTITGFKRNGEAIVLSGMVTEIVGSADHEAVKIETEKGTRSINLYNIRSVSNS